MIATKTMMQSLLLTLPTLALVSGYHFQPETKGLLAGDFEMTPAFYNLSTTLTSSNTLAHGSDSFWTSSYLRCSNGHDYFVITHLAVFSGSPITTRGAVLDITEGTGYTSRTNTSSTYTVYDATTGVFNATVGDFQFGCLNASDPTSLIRTAASVPGVQYDITFEGTSPALLNGAVGDLYLGGGHSYEWAIPAAPSSGFLVVNGTKVTIDSTQSITWFDRQFGGTGGGFSWHWFELHIKTKDSSDLIPMSIWLEVDTVHGSKNFASIREAVGQQVLAPITSATPSNRTWTSTQSNITYNLDWTLTMTGDTSLQLKLITGDQELTTTTGASLVYEGFLTVTGTYKGKPITGYGLMEVVA